MEKMKEVMKGVFKDPQVVRVASAAVGALVGGALTYFGVRALNASPSLMAEEAGAEVVEVIAKKATKKS